jgi:DUF4097 and DUF4098 domain-containing protein YvlB
MRAVFLSWAAPAILLAGAGTLFADSRVERTLKLDPGGTFRLDTDAGSVTVRGKSGNGAHVLFESSRDDLEDRLRIQFDEGTGSASVTAKNRHSSWFDNGRNRVQVTVEVPFDTAVDVRTSGGSITLSGTKRPAKLRSSGGSLHVEDLGAGLDGDTSGGGVHVHDVTGDARVRSSGGSIEAARIHGSLDADTSGGSVRVEAVTGDIKARSSGGPIHIRAASGKVDAETSGGGADVAFAPGNGKGGRIESSGGGITVSLDPSVGLEIDAHAERIDSDLPITTTRGFSRESLHGTLNGGGASLRLETSGGSVHITHL